MASSILKRVSATTEATVSAIAAREDRSFVSQLDRIVDAGLHALGETVPTRDGAPAPVAATTTTKRKRK